MTTDEWAAFWAHHEPAQMHAGPRRFCIGDHEPWPCAAALAQVKNNNA